MSVSETQEAVHQLLAALSTLPEAEVRRIAVELLEAVKVVAVNDQSPDYVYPGQRGGPIVNRLGQRPKGPGKRWATPREIVLDTVRPLARTLPPLHQAPEAAPLERP